MRWDEHTSVELAKRIERDPVAILPLAAIEQHGPHLPLSTDVDIGAGILTEALARLDDEVPVVVLPTQAIGTSLEHARFPGTLTLRSDALEESLLGLAASVADAGVRRLVISNSHGGNKAAIDEVALHLRAELGMLVVKASYFRFPRPEKVVLPESEWTHGLHGGAVETAMMLHLRPDLVREEEVRRFASFGEELEADMAHLAPEGAAPFAWLAGDLNPDGVVGDATLATASMGERLVAHYGSILAEVVRDAHAFPLDRLALDP